MEMLGHIMSVSVFLQLSSCGVITAVALFQLESVGVEILHCLQRSCWNFPFFLLE